MVERPKINDFNKLLLNLKTVLPKFAPDINSRDVVIQWFPPFERFSKEEYVAVFEYARDNLTEFPSSPKALLEVFNTLAERKHRDKPLKDLKQLAASSKGQKFAAEENKQFVQDLLKIIREGNQKPKISRKSGDPPPQEVIDFEREFGVDAFEAKFGKGSYYRNS